MSPKGRRNNPKFFFFKSQANRAGFRKIFTIGCQQGQQHRYFVSHCAEPRQKEVLSPLLEYQEPNLLRTVLEKHRGHKERREPMLHIPNVAYTIFSESSQSQTRAFCLSAADHVVSFWPHKTTWCSRGGGAIHQAATPKHSLKSSTFYGNELSTKTFKLALTNLYLHNISDTYCAHCSIIDPSYRVECVQVIRS